MDTEEKTIFPHSGGAMIIDTDGEWTWIEIGDEWIRMSRSEVSRLIAILQPLSDTENV